MNIPKLKENKTLNEGNPLRDAVKEIVASADTRLLRMIHAVSSEYNNPMIEEPQVKKERELYRLVYTSARNKACDDQNIHQILQASNRNNKRLGVTGVLIHTPERFLQVLEGTEDTVQALYEKIEKDPRHGGSVMRYCEPVSTRYFGDWNMAGKKINEAEVEYNTGISTEKKKLYKSMINGDIQSYKDEGMRVLKTFLLFS